MTCTLTEIQPITGEPYRRNRPAVQRPRTFTTGDLARILRCDVRAVMQLARRPFDPLPLVELTSVSGQVDDVTFVAWLARQTSATAPAQGRRGRLVAA
jgi:hypothetical protein